MGKYLTQEEVAKRSILHGIKLVGIYTGQKDKVDFECLSCGKIFLAKPRDTIAGDVKSCGCKSHLSQENVEQRALIHGIKVTGKFTRAVDKIECECPLCGNLFYPYVYDLVKGRTKSCGCLSNFQDLTRITQEEAEKRSLEAGVKLVGKYIAQHRQTEFKCPKCKAIFLCRPKDIWKKRILTCGDCNYQNIKIGNKIGKYTITKITRCKFAGFEIEAQCECGNTWKGLRHDFVKHGQRCDKCGITINGRVMLVKNKILTSSNVFEIHKMIDYEGIHNYKYGIYNIDIALAKNNTKIAIEYDEWYWHKDRLDSNKKKFRKLQKNGWKILHIKGKRNLPSQEVLMKKLNELIYTNAKIRTIKLKGWGT